ncbi:protein of unknown function [Kyrpidia spormannii]|uniref:Uncharacterized protein n=1 Tax=Kyrpidia spormannii TaxID=2055160 RepID=A0ACA8Z7N2_9BACL|nr:protein of unknown function [Kyrpidia spormannii]
MDWKDKADVNRFGTLLLSNKHGFRKDFFGRRRKMFVDGAIFYMNTKYTELGVDRWI